jgi:eukaryotic-like serine/threonine-protein kinase
MELPDPIRLAVGSEVLLGRFEVEDLLGHGGFGAVYRAQDLLLQRAVALKVLPREPAGSEPVRRQDEMRLLATLGHPALVTLYEVFDAGDRTVLVMELVEGTTLQSLLATAPLDPAAAAAVAVDLASALDYIHGRGVVHRDVKPSNILVSRDDGGVHAKLSDFGIATGATPEQPAPAGDLVGTVRFVSPEQAGGREVGPASDVYSLGLTLLAALSGARSGPADPREAVRQRILLDPSIPTTLDYGWRSLLTAMTARSPAFRPPAAEVLRRAQALADATAGPGRSAQSEELHTMPMDIRQF